MSDHSSLRSINISSGGNDNRKNRFSQRFYKSYMKFCNQKHYQIIPEIKEKRQNVLDFYSDRVKFHDWRAIIYGLQKDSYLEFIAIRIRKKYNDILENADTEKKTRKITDRPCILTKYIFTDLLDTFSESLKWNENLTTLIFDGFPISDKYAAFIAKGLSQNISIKLLSFENSKLLENSCDIICSPIKHLLNIETLNLSNCNLNQKNILSIGNLIKFQKIYRFSEGWKVSLRYEGTNTHQMPGLKRISINNNPEIGDEGLEQLLEILTEDEWITYVEMRNCGITDDGAKSIIECLTINKTLLMFDIQNNGISQEIQTCINQQFNVDQEDYLGNLTANSSASSTMTISQLKERIRFLEQQLEDQLLHTKQVDKLNEQLHSQLLEYKRDMSSTDNSLRIPAGYTLIKQEDFDELISNQNSVSLNENSSDDIIASKRVNNAQNKFKNELFCKNSTQYSTRSTRSVGDGQYNQPNISNRTYTERNIGDGVLNNFTSNTEQFAGIDNLNAYVGKKNIVSTKNISSARHLFMGKKTKEPMKDKDWLI